MGAKALRMAFEGFRRATEVLRMAFEVFRVALEGDRVAFEDVRMAFEVFLRTLKGFVAGSVESLVFVRRAITRPALRTLDDAGWDRPMPPADLARPYTHTLKSQDRPSPASVARRFASMSRPLDCETRGRARGEGRSIRVRLTRRT